MDKSPEMLNDAARNFAIARSSQHGVKNEIYIARLLLDMLHTLLYSTISLFITYRLRTNGDVLLYRSTSFRYGKVPLFSSLSLEFCSVCCYFPLSDCWSNALLTRFFKNLIQIRDLKMKD